MAAQGKDKKPGKHGPMSGTPSESLTQVEAVRGLRLCLLRKWTNFKGYGFDLNVDPNVPEHFIAQVDIDSPAELGGVRKNDRIIEVNGLPVDDKSHLEVVELIKREPKKVQLLVIDPETDKAFASRHERPSSLSAGLLRLRSPTEHPKSNMREARQQLAAAKAAALPSADLRFIIEDSTTNSQNLPVEKLKPDKASKASKSARSSKLTKPAAKGGSTSGTSSPLTAASMSKAEAELHRKHGEAREQLVSDEEVGATQPQPELQPTEHARHEAETLRHSAQPVAESLAQEADGSSLATAASPTFAPPYYPTDQNYYGGLAEGSAVDTAGYYWPSDADQSWTGMVPYLPEYSAASMSYSPPNTPAITGAYSQYQPPGLFWSPPMMPPAMPYQAPPVMPIMPLPFYGYPGSYAPGYSDFVPLYSGSPSYPAVPYACANPYGQPAQEAGCAVSPPPQAEAVRAPLRRRADAAAGRRDGPVSGQRKPPEQRQGQNRGAC